MAELLTEGRGEADSHPYFADRKKKKGLTACQEKEGKRGAPLIHDTNAHEEKIG